MNELNSFFNEIVSSTQNINTCKVGEVVKYHKENHSVDVIPFPTKDNSVILNVPVVTTKTSEFIIYYPLKPKDKVLLVFTDGDSENIKLGVDSAQTERSHDITDCFCIGGFTLINENLNINDPESLSIQTVDNTATISITSNGDINIKCKKFKVEADRIDLN